MKKTDLLKQSLAGMFFIVCVVLITGVVFVIGVEKGLTEPKFEMSVYFNKVGGLAVGAPVRISGVTVGTVRDIGFLEQEVGGRGVHVILAIYQKFEKQMRKSSRVAIITEGVLGEKSIEVTTEPTHHRLNLRQPIIGDDPLDIQNLAETFGDSATALFETSKSIDLIIGEMRDISLTVRRLLGRIEQRVIDGNLFKVF